MSDKWIRSLEINGKRTYLIHDYHFWVTNMDKLLDWLAEHTEDGIDTLQGMTLNFSNETEEFMFILRWGR